MAAERGDVPEQVTLPAEWAPQDGVLLVWPPSGSPWAASGALAEVEATFARLVATISRYEQVLLVVPEVARVRALLVAAGAELAAVTLLDAPADDCWARDLGPITVRRDGRPTLLDFTFNGWGGKYRAVRDNALTRLLHARRAFGATPLTTVDLVLEGGSIESDGAGTILTTAACLLTPTRNPQLDRAGVVAALRTWLGAMRVLLLEHGWLSGDDTDAHVDMLARFAPGDVILHATCPDAADEHHPHLTALAAELATLRTIAGAPYRLLPLPIPAAKYDAAGQRLPGSYANFLVINGAVLVPTYRDAADAPALATIARAFPGRAVIGLDCLPLIHQFGSLHCVTMQLPQGVLPCRT